MTRQAPSQGAEPFSWSKMAPRCDVLSQTSRGVRSGKAKKFLLWTSHLVLATKGAALKNSKTEQEKEP